MPMFRACKDKVFKNPIDFVNHLHSMSEDYYHRIIMRIVQGLYSPLLSKLKTKQNSSNKEYKKGFSSFASVHKGTLKLPAHVTSNFHYNLFRFKRKDVPMVLYRTNLLTGNIEREFTPYFSETSFQKTLTKLISSGSTIRPKREVHLCTVLVVQ